MFGPSLAGGCGCNDDWRHEERQQTFRFVFEGGLRPVIELTARFLGDDPDVTGGSMGMPRRPPEWMFMLMGALANTFFKATLVVFDPPYSRRETSKRAYKRYLWHMVGFHD